VVADLGARLPPGLGVGDDGAQVEAIPLPMEKLKNGVPEVTGRPLAGSATPATASTTCSPFR
jgi:hypothetical protein